MEPGELDALPVACDLVQGKLIYVGDNEAVIDGWRRQIWFHPASDWVTRSDTPLWMASWDEVGRAAPLHEHNCSLS